VTDAQSLPTRIALAGAAALCAVLVPGQAAELMERPLRVPQWRPARRRLRGGPDRPSPSAYAVTTAGGGP
jgi:hypothetical protein